MNVTVRVLGADEAAVLDHVAPEVFDRPVDPRRRTEFFADPRHHLAVALDGDLVVGFASALRYVHPDKPPELWINEVGVAPSHRRRGLGRRLVEALLQLGASLGCVQAWVLTSHDNVAAQRLYQAAGGEASADAAVMFEFPLAPRSSADGSA